jgi:hypothetical protein
LLSFLATIINTSINTLKLVQQVISCKCFG